MCHYRWGSGRQHCCEEQVLIALALTERHRLPVTFWSIPGTHLQTWTQSNTDTPLLQAGTHQETHTDTPLLQAGTHQETHSATLAGDTPVTGPSATLPGLLRGHLPEVWLLITEFHGKDTS